MPCLTAKPIVDGFERDLEGRAEVVRLNVTSEVGRQVAAEYGVEGVPTTVVVDAEGEVVHRHTGIPSRKTIVAEASGAA